jgi:uncharacterized membrane protein
MKDMFKNPMYRIVWVSVFTLIADFAALRGLYVGRADGLSIIGATIISFGLIYLIATYRIDGPDSMKRENADERIRSIADKSCRIGFFVLFLCTWSLAFLINMPGLNFLMQNIAVTIATVAMIGLFAHWLSFVWYKYHVR